MFDDLMAYLKSIEFNWNNKKNKISFFKEKLYT